jgi:RNA polymerase sigma factor (sigma-70 family)
MPTDSDGYIRRTALTRKSGERRYYSLAFQVFLKEQGLSPESVRVEPNQELQISGYPPIPLDEKNTLFINFTGGPGVFPGVSFYQAYQNMIPEGFFKDKIVLIGPEFTGSKDFYWTPFVNRSLGEKMAGVEIHAHIVDMLLGKQWIEKLSLSFQSLILVLADIVLIFLFLILSRRRNLILAWGGIFAVFIFSSYFLLSAGNLFLPPVLVLWNLVFFLLLFIFLNQAAEIFTKKKLVEELEKQMEATREGKKEVSEKFMQEISPREKEIIDLVLAGKTNAQIAKKLFISVNTVKRHVYNIYQKTRVKSRVEFVKKFK